MTMDFKLRSMPELRDRSVSAVSLITLLVTALIFTQPSSAIEFTHGSRDFNRHAYVATGYNSL